MNEKLLERIGLSRAEIKVYVALLELGITTTGPLTRRSGVHSSNIYSILNELISKGLVSYTIKANKKYFKAEDPHRLKGFLQEQQNQLEEQQARLSDVIEDLVKRQRKIEKKQEVFTYEGIKGIKTALEFVLKILKKGDTFYVLDASRISNDKLMGYFNDFHKRRAQRKINYKIVYGMESIEFAKERKTFPLTEVRVLPRDIRIPSVFWVFREYVVIAVFSEEPVALMIKDPDIADSFLTYFNIMRQIAKEI